MSAVWGIPQLSYVSYIYVYIIEFETDTSLALGRKTDECSVGNSTTSTERSRLKLRTATQDTSLALGRKTDECSVGISASTRF
jgi:hypothetical protein